jgi:endonuclease YncB( thermonuclease family)
VRGGQDVQRIRIEPISGDQVLPAARSGRGWLAYLYLANGRMLNAELIRVGLARPRAESQNVRYLDLFQELAGTATP